MLKKFIFCILALTLLSTSSKCSNGVEPEIPDGPQADVELLPLSAQVVVNRDWVFEGRPELVIHVDNPNESAVEAEAKAKITTDKGQDVTTVLKKVTIAGKGSEDIVLTTPDELPAGYYKASCRIDDKVVRLFCFGISPFGIVSAPDKQDDFDAFWDEAKKQLASVKMNPVLTEIPSKSTAAQKVYLVEMQSVPDGPDADPVTIRGYYLEPQDGEKHPVLMHFYGYDTLNNPSFLTCPGGSSSPEYAEFYLSTRGQMINHRTADKRTKDGMGDFVNAYGDWFAFGFGHKDSYYYRGAFMDCVQAVRFMATRPTSDMDNLFGEGSSQGGALSYAAAALSDYPFIAIAPCVAFLGDFPDYFDIVGWPGDVAKKNRGAMTDAEMYAFLSYFDTKNLATRISCAVIACSGLQDQTCPPHTNIAPFNNLQTTDKEFHFYPEMGHEIPGNWAGKYSEFFKARMK